MNMVFGLAGSGKKNSDQLTRFVEYSASTHKIKPTIVSNADDIKLAFSTNKGKTMGSTKSGSVSLVLSGFVHAPLPGWKDKNATPLDNPDATAAHLLSRYLRLGPKFLNNVYGQFSVVVCDAVKGRVLLALDPSGHNDMFYYKKGGQITFSSKLRALAESLDEDLEVDRSYEDFFLIYGFYPKNKTMYKGVRSIPKQTILVWHKGKVTTSKISFKKLPVQDNTNEDVLIENLHEAMISATNDILPKTKKVAVLLGGFDSALIAALLKKCGAEVETFSFYYEDSKFNQKNTNMVAKHLGIKHNWVKIDEKVIEKGMKSYADTFNQATNWPNYVIQTEHLAKAIRKRGFYYCYTGDGCDYLFFGYPITYKRAQFLSFFGAIPNPLLTFLIKAAEIPVLERVIGRPYQVALGVLRGARRNPVERNFLTFRIFDEMSLKQLRGKNRPRQAESIDSLIKELSRPHSKLSPIRLAYQGKMQLAPYRIKMNGSTDATGLVLASPYLHYRVKHLALSLPDKYLRPTGAGQVIGKYILAKMAEKKKLLPYEVIYQPKMGAVDAPLSEWYNGPLKRTMYKLISGLPFKFNKKYVESLIKPKKAEDVYSSFISKDTSNIVTLTHCISLLATYANFTAVVKHNKK